MRRFIGDLDAPPPDHETWLRVLDSADFVKFARVEPSPEDLDKDYETVRSFVDKTRPTPDPEKKDVPKEEAA
ncbi:MAG: hypothetical protein M5R36_17990 [Deltaproteobacteria bacterium]|nr:hypothetical protein [Deltaproteobacteria bacterium]